MGKIPVVAFVTESYQELKKVTWPSRQQIIKLSGIVAVASLATGAYLGALDYIFIQLVGFILNR